MNNIIRGQFFLRLLQNEIHHQAVVRTIHTSTCVGTTKSKEGDEDASPDGEKTKPDEPSRSAATTKNLFGTLAGMKAISSRNTGPLTGDARDENSPLLKKSGSKFASSNFKTSEALKSAVTQAAKIVSESFPDKEKTESDLVQQLRRYDEAKAAGERGEVDAIGALLKGMKVESTQGTTQGVTVSREESRESQQDKTPQSRPSRRDGLHSQYRETVHRTEGAGLREGKRLGIFSPPKEEITQPDTDVTVHIEAVRRTIWEEHEVNELQEIQQGQHRHGFDEMIEWTRDGKLWKYPIDNEQGFEEEQAIGFHEHVLLDDLIEDFPKTGPIRDFMELVILGLSKNPYFTVRQKKEHIDWFRQYFKDKEDVLREAESLPKEFSFA